MLSAFRKSQVERMVGCRQLWKANTIQGEHWSRVKRSCQGSIANCHSADEVLELLPNTNDLADSPELGPPPVAHFEAGDPIEFDANQQGSPRKARLEGAGRIDPALLVNLETRRKRRESSQLVDDTVAGSINPRKTQQEEIPGHSRSEPTLKSGAKRKFSAREDDEYKEAPDAPLKDDFQYNRTQENRVPENPSHKETEQVKPASVQPGKHVGQKIPHDLARKQERPRGRPRTNIDPMPSNRSVLAPSKLRDFCNRNSLSNVFS